MQCEIIPDMFGKILSPNDTSRKKSGRTDRTAAVRRVTRAFMWSCDWIFLFKTSHNVCHRVAFLLDEASKGRIHREEKKNSEIVFLGKKKTNQYPCCLRDKTEGFARRPVGAVSPTFT